MLNYREDPEVSKEYKKKYLEGFEALIKRRERDAAVRRSDYFADIFSYAERYRTDLEKMIGWPLTDYAPCDNISVESVKLADEENHEVYRMSFEILGGLYLSGLLYKMKEEVRRPLVIVQHGGLGTPEHIAGFVGGNTSNYNDMLERVVNQGVHAFAPQLLLWNREQYGIDFERREIDGRLKRVGSSVAAVEIYGIRRILDYFESKTWVKCFGMVGLSYGGFYTLFTSALDTRIKSAISCSFFNTRDNYGWPDLLWRNSAEKFDDAEVACLVYPRKLRIFIGKNDPLFLYQGGVDSFERVKKICSSVGTDWISFNVFDGVHEFIKDDEPIRELVYELNNEEF